MILYSGCCCVKNGSNNAHKKMELCIAHVMGSVPGWSELLRRKPAHPLSHSMHRRHVRRSSHYFSLGNMRNAQEVQDYNL